MTCTHVSTLFDAGRLSGVTQEDIERAIAHAATCPTCGPALAQARAVTGALRDLALPVPPARLASAVMARLAGIERHAGAAHRATHRPTTASSPDWVGVTSSLGMGLGLALVVMFSQAGDGLRLWTGIDGAALPTPASTAVMLLGLALYLTGLFALPRRRV